MAPSSSSKEGPSKTSNLTRIRDNQRRSRARRKEYLSELESKLSNCERVGVEASAEIQVAARRVMEENRRLRALMARHGIVVEEAEAAAELEGMLGRRRECGGGGRAAPTSGGGSPAIASTSGSVHSAATSQTAWTRDDEGAPRFQAMQHGVTDHDTTNTNSYDTANTNYDPYYPTNPPLPNAHMPDAGIYDFDEFPADPTFDEPNHSSCRSVAGAIRSIRPDVGDELEVDLGCRSAEDCRVPNLRAFDVIDRYSSGAGETG